MSVGCWKAISDSRDALIMNSIHDYKQENGRPVIFFQCADYTCIIRGVQILMSFLFYKIKQDILPKAIVIAGIFKN